MSRLDDALPELVDAFVRGSSDGAELLAEVHRHARRVALPYPAAYFPLQEKSDDGYEELGHRVFASCARVEKGRFPFQGRTPFVCYTEERFDGRAIRYHSFYAKLSITREMLRDDYARNLRRDPTLRRRAELYAAIGRVLKASCDRVAPGPPPTWGPRASGARRAGLRAMLTESDLERDLRASGLAEVEPLVLRALERGGPRSQSRLTYLLEAVLPAPADEAEPPAPAAPEPVSELQIAVRRAVSAAWAELGEDERALLAALARGDSYDDLIATFPAFKHRVAVSRAVSRVSTGFMDRVLQEVGGEAAPTARPRQIIEYILGVLLEIVPDLEAGEPAGGER